MTVDGHYASPPTWAGCTPVSLTGSAGTAVHTTPLTTAQADIFRHCQVVPPAAITALDPG